MRSSRGGVLKKLSLDEAVRATGASKKAISAISDVMRDRMSRTDEQMAAAAPAIARHGRRWSQDAVRHARLALQLAGLLRDTGKHHPTSNGGRARVWQRA